MRGKRWARLGSRSVTRISNAGLVDASLIKKYSLFVLEVVKAHAADGAKFPQTLHYRGDGLFMIAGPNTSKYRKGFRPQNSVMAAGAGDVPLHPLGQRAPCRSGSPR